MKKTLTLTPAAPDAAPAIKKKGRGWEISASRLDALHDRAREMRHCLTLLALLFAAPTLAAEPPREVARYADCVRMAFLNPGEETGATFDTALDLAKAQCGNLRTAAVEVLKKTTTRTMTTGGDTPESAAQAMLDIMVLEQAAAIWAEAHPGEVYHGR